MCEMRKIFIIVSILLSFSLSAQVKHKIAILYTEDRSGKIDSWTLADATDYLRMYLETVES